MEFPEIVIVGFALIIAILQYAIPAAALVLVILVYAKVNRIEWLLSRQSSAEGKQVNIPSSTGGSRSH